MIFLVDIYVLDMYFKIWHKHGNLSEALILLQPLIAVNTNWKSSYIIYLGRICVGQKTEHKIVVEVSS